MRVDEIVFSKIVASKVFVSDFNPLTKNNSIDLSDKNIAIVYGPNGTGKTSLIRALDNDSELQPSIEYKINNVKYSDGTPFSIIRDQKQRNVIQGEANDFLIGDNVEKEMRLKKQVDEERDSVFGQLKKVMKDNLLDKKDLPSLFLSSDIVDKTMIDYLSILANRSGKIESIKTEILFKLFCSKHSVDKDYDERKVEEYKRDISNRALIQVLDIASVARNSSVKKVEENDDALKILTKYPENKQCIVCDNDIDPNELVIRRNNEKQSTLARLDDKTKSIISDLIPKFPEGDLFKAKESLLKAIETGDSKFLISLQDDIKNARKQFTCELLNSFEAILNNSNLLKNETELQLLIEQKFEIEEEDVLFIKEFMNSCVRKNLDIVRDEKSKNLVIRIGGMNLLGNESLPLSLGELNFISLSFEFLKARKNKQHFVIIDDPISSFDSIYKNKIVYEIVKFLEKKKTIILTHNIDVIRLLNAQYSNCFSLYVLNNVDNGNNGFVPISAVETELLVDLSKLLGFFREDASKYLLPGKEKDFLVSLIPFLRSYSAIIGENKCYSDLCMVMHGYENGSIDVGAIYMQLFHGNCKIKQCSISVEDILQSSQLPVEIIDAKQYPLLNKTLCDSYAYLFLRLFVEKTLTEHFNISGYFSPNQPKSLGSIISEAFPESGGKTCIRNRVELTSKKTLLNEFNHFEGNLSIFQPALDISDEALKSEKQDIINFCNQFIN